MSIETGNVNVSQALGSAKVAPKDSGNIDKRNAQTLDASVNQDVVKQYDAPQAKQPIDGVEQALSSAELAEFVDKVQDFVNTFDNRLRFDVDEKSGRSIVTVVDAKTGDLVRQIPSEEMLKLVQNLSDRGVLVDTKA